MALTLNRGMGSLLCAPGGYPVRLRANGETEVIAMAHRHAETVTAVVQASKTATAWLGIFHAPYAFSTQAGTITATAGSRTVTGSSTTFTQSTSSIRQGLTGFEIRPISHLWTMRVGTVISDTKLTLVDEVPTGGSVSGVTWQAGSGETVVVDRDTDGEITATYQVSAAVDSSETTLVLDFPDTELKPPRAYLVKLWVTEITGETFDDTIRLSSITDETTQPKIGGYVDVVSMSVT